VSLEYQKKGAFATNEPEKADPDKGEVEDWTG
jgi:hypothetical protein